MTKNTPTSTSALDYHQYPTPGKLEVISTKPVANQKDLSLAYSPGVAEPCLEIAKNPSAVAKYTIRQNLVAVVSNGTAVLGLGNIGPLASKPVMEGKAVLFKKFANINVFDIEITPTNVDEVVKVVSALEPTFGGINLEDIKSPECFEIEKRLSASMNIPVFHDDQHGTAIIVSAAVTNGLKLLKKKPEDIKLVSSGAGAAGIACLNLLLEFGIKRENIWICDAKGVVYKGRQEAVDEYKAKFAQDTSARTLIDIMPDADVFLGLSVADILTPEMVKLMAPNPLILALANPNPEIKPHLAMEVRPDAIVCTGRTDYPNQVNNALCFPYIFRGALDVGATKINTEMKKAAVKAISDLTFQKIPVEISNAYNGETFEFGKNYIIPKPFDPRLISTIAPAVAKAAMDSGVATLPIEDLSLYTKSLEDFAYQSGMVMRPVFLTAQRNRKRVIFAEGEDERVLNSLDDIINEGIAQPILVGRPSVIQHRLEKNNIKAKIQHDFLLINPEEDPRYKDYVKTYLDKVERKGITPNFAKTAVRTNNTVIAGIALLRQDADALLCGLEGNFKNHLKTIEELVGIEDSIARLSTLTGLIIDNDIVFLTDTQVIDEPSLDEITSITLGAVDFVKVFGIKPKVALISNSNFGSRNSKSGRLMQQALTQLRGLRSDVMIDGEMQVSAALLPHLRQKFIQHSHLGDDKANLLVFPNLDSASVATETLRAMGAIQIGPILLGTCKSAHILNPDTTSRGILNMTAIASLKS